ncbi:hypothetical protein GCM10027289_29730 [Tsukamurella serpentis]
MLRRFLDYEMKVSEFIGFFILIGIPYLLIGVVWSATHTDHLGALDPTERFVSFLGAIVCWPVLIFTNVTMR